MAFVAPHGAFATSPSAHGTLIVVRLVHPSNIGPSIVVGFPVNVIDVKPVQPLNARLLILVSPLGNEVRANLIQS